MNLSLQVTVIDVIDANSCICRTDDSQVLDGSSLHCLLLNVVFLKFLDYILYISSL